MNSRSCNRLGWRGEVFLVDDNFIGNKRKVLELLPAVTEWQRARGYPFSLITEASVNLANTDELLDGMATAGFNNVFLGIETPNTEALVKTRKQQNTSKRETNYLLDAVRKIQRKGVRVAAGFIVGLDGEDERVFDAQIDFIRAAGIPLAMVGLLNVPKGTDLHDRMRREGRLLQATDGNQLSLTLDFVPEMDARVLLEGYRRMLATLYGPGLDGYFERCLTMLRNVGFNPRLTRPPLKELLRALATSARRQLLSRQGPAYLKFLANVVRHDPRQLPEAFSLAVLGYHFEMIASQEIAVYDFKEFLAAELRAFETAPPPRGGSGVKPAAAGRRARALLQRAQARYESIHGDFRARLNGPLASFRSAVEAMASPSTRA